MSAHRLRQLIPAAIVAGVLAFSYFAPAFGFGAPPVNSPSTTNCGRFGYGYHGGKHLFVCPHATLPPPAGPVFPPATPPPQTFTPVPANLPAVPASALAARGKAQAAAVRMAWRGIIADTLVITASLSNLQLDPVTAREIAASLTP